MYQPASVPRTHHRPHLQDGEPARHFLARQPIVDARLKIHGYELLFRNGFANMFPRFDPDAATCHVIDFSLLYGAAELTGNRAAFINCTRNILLSDVITVLPRDRVVAEVLETVPADPETIAACERLHRAGYRIALDDFVPTPRYLALLPYTDIVKVDFLATSEEEQGAIAREIRHYGIALLAEKIESGEQFLRAQELGYNYFQGYFFSPPEPYRMRCVSPDGVTYLQVLGVANREAYDLDRLEQAILGDPSLCSRLLQCLCPSRAQLPCMHSTSCRRALRSRLRKLLQVALCCEHGMWQNAAPGEENEIADVPVIDSARDAWYVDL